MWRKITVWVFQVICRHSYEKETFKGKLNLNSSSKQPNRIARVDYIVKEMKPFISECNKLGKKVNKTRHNGGEGYSLGIVQEFIKWYTQKPESILKNQTQNSWILRYEVPSISFQTFFVQAFKIVLDPWKFTMLLLYILWDHWTLSMISGSNEQLQQELEYTLLKPDCHGWGISKMQSGREHTLEERYAIKFCFKLEKKKCHRNIWNASDCFWSILHEPGISFWVA